MKWPRLNISESIYDRTLKQKLLDRAWLGLQIDTAHDLYTTSGFRGPSSSRWPWKLFVAENGRITCGNSTCYPEYKNISFADLALRTRSQGPREIVDFDQIKRLPQLNYEVAGNILQFSVIELGSLNTEHLTRPTSLKGQGHRSVLKSSIWGPTLLETSGYLSKAVRRRHPICNAG